MPQESEGQGIVIPQFQPQPQPTDNPSPPVSLEGLSEFASGVLSGIPEADRGVVAKYLKDWDGNVTKKFQEIHTQYEPYKNLGEPETLQEAMYYHSMLQNDPSSFVQMLQEAIEEANMNDPEFQPELENGPVGGEIAPEIDARFGKMEQMLGNMLNQFQQFTGGYQEQQQLAQFDNMLKDMHSKHGDFDDDVVSLYIERGMQPEDAIKAFQENIVKKYGSPSHRPAPLLPPTNGANFQQGQVDTSKLSKDDRKRFGADILRANFQD